MRTILPTILMREWWNDPELKETDRPDPFDDPYMDDDDDYEEDDEDA
jgi:hypothetical protein